MGVVLSGIDVESAEPRDAIVTFGDLITDGAFATRGYSRRWPDILAARLQKAGIDAGVANMGIAGNRLLRDGAADSGLRRFDHDVLAIPGVSRVIVLEGINDIGARARPGSGPLSAQDLIDGLSQLVARAHARGIKIILGTIIPYGGRSNWDAEGEAIRTGVNAWIRTTHEADGFVDFDRAVADPRDPTKMARALDSGDHVHPNDAGHAAMAAAIDLDLLK